MQRADGATDHDRAGPEVRTLLRVTVPKQSLAARGVTRRGTAAPFWHSAIEASCVTMMGWTAAIGCVGRHQIFLRDLFPIKFERPELSEN